MQIREQGRKIQCIRTVYDKDIGRGRQLVVASIPRWRTGAPTDDELAKLTVGERQELTNYLAKLQKESEESNKRYAVISADTWMKSLATALNEGQSIRPAQADAIWESMGDVAKALRKAGYSKPKPVKLVQPAEVQTNAPQPEGESQTPSATERKPKPKPGTNAKPKPQEPPSENAETPTA